MKSAILRTATIATGLFVFGSATPVVADGEMMQLVWSDDFDGTGKIDRDKWTVVRGNGCPQLCGFGNNERQTYTGKKRNLRIEDGKLVIEAHKRKTYTSAKVTTQQFDGWKYGKISVRAKLPRGIGTWPAIWMLPDVNSYGNWPQSGEIDIMEHVGFREGVVHGTVHTEAYNHKINTQKGAEIKVPDAADAFHTYSIEWNEAHISWSIDGQQYYQFNKLEGDGSEEWPFDQPFHLILNLAVGGDWGGREGVDRNAFPTRFEIDWVKIWQQEAGG